MMDDISRLRARPVVLEEPAPETAVEVILEPDVEPGDESDDDPAAADWA